MPEQLNKAKAFFKQYTVAGTVEADLYSSTGKELEDVLPDRLIEKLDTLDSEIQLHLKHQTHEKRHN